jgi:hypothetical protein
MIRPLLYLPLVALLLGATPSVAQPEGLDKAAKKLHALAGGENCRPLEDAYDADDAYQSWTFSYPVSWGTDGEEDEITLIRIWCMSGAYNEVHAYYVHREFEGLTPLPFAVPAYKAEYEGDDSEGTLTALKILGMNATTTLINSQYDPETRTITSYSLWRGIGDASEAGTWTFGDGRWALTNFAIDATYDEEVNPEVVYNVEE